MDPLRRIEPNVNLIENIYKTLCDNKLYILGRLAQLVESACLTSRRSLVRIQQRPLDEAMDADERVLEGFVVFLDEDEDGTYDNGEALTFSSADGTYEFAGLDADRSYSVSQILHFGWSSTYAGPSATPSGGPSPPIAAIVNGEDADIEVFPFQVALRTTATQFQFCGGTLLNSRYVLTAAHCVFEMPADEIEILIGSADLNSGGERVKVQAVRSHPEFGATIDYDIAILRLEGSHLYPRVYVQAPDQPSYSTPGDTATAIGWGQTETGDPSDLLKWTTLPIITNEECGKIAGFMFGNITDRVICAGAERLGRGICFGDSGGPLLVPYRESWMEVGVSSFLVNRDHPDGLRKGVRAIRLYRRRRPDRGLTELRGGLGHGDLSAGGLRQLPLGLGLVQALAGWPVQPMWARSCRGVGRGPVWHIPGAMEPS